MGEFVSDKWQDILYRAFQHLSLVVQSVLLATVIAILLAVLVTSVPSSSRPPTCSAPSA